MTALLIAFAFAALTALTGLGIMAVVHQINWWAVAGLFVLTFCVDLFALALCNAAGMQSPD